MISAREGNIAGLLLSAAGRDPQAPAIRFGSEQISHEELDGRIAGMAALLRDRGVAAGDRVGLLLANVPEFAIAYYAILQAGAIAVPISTLLTPAEASFCLDDAEARLALVSTGAPGRSPGRETLEIPRGLPGPARGQDTPAEIVPRGGEDTAVIIYTSGTTGRPKGAQLTHRNLARNAAAIIESTPISRSTVALGALPLSHSFGQTWMLGATLRSGGCVSLLERFEAQRALETIAEHGVTFFAGVPTMFAQLAEAQASIGKGRLTLCVSGGAALAPELMRRFEDRFGCEVREGYGLSETSPLVSLNPPGEGRRPGSVGLPIPGVELKILDADEAPLAAGLVGEILVRGHNIMKGYWRRPEETAEAITADGWFRTGDLGYLDEDGYLFISGRKKELIIRGGYNVYPREVEDALLEHPAVAEAAVIPLPHPTLGEEVGAAIRLHDGASSTPDELSEHARERLAAYKYPRSIWLVERLPTGPTGKVLKRLIEPPDALAAPARQNPVNPTTSPTEEHT
jgi:long-chain acyl-CoA synthetase